MVFFVSYDAAGTVYLFGEHEANQLVRKNQRRKAPSELCPFPNGITYAKGATDEEYQVFFAVVGPLLNKCGKAFATE